MLRPLRTGRCALALIFLLAVPGSLFAQKIMQYNDQVFDFGHVGIEFTVLHTFKYINETDKPIHILGMDVPCDCSNVVASDTVINPGDTAFFRLSMATRNLYGPTNKSFKVKTDNPDAPELQYFDLSIVGQWFNGLKPTPLSLFFLPGKKSEMVSIPNFNYSSIEVTDHFQYDSTFTFKILKKEADKGDKIEIEFAPAPGLTKGTYFSNLTLEITKGDETTTILTIPIKIVRY